MANEFKVKKGLIVDGSNTVLDIQGTQGQLFSVTDSLVGDLFSISDISGIPIFNVNSGGLSTFDGDLTIVGNVTNRLKLSRAPGANNTDPTLAFGDGNTGFYERSDNDLRVAIGGVNYWEFSSNCMGNVNEGKAHLNSETATATNPSIIPWRNDSDTGIGRSSANVLSLIAGGTESLSLSATAATFVSNLGIGGAPANASHGSIGTKLDMKGGPDSIIILRGAAGGTSPNDWAASEYGLYAYDGEFSLTRTNVSSWWTAPDFKLSGGLATFASRVGIGVTASSNAMLDVKGPDTDDAVLGRFYSNTGSRGSFIIRNGEATSPTTFIGTAGGSEELSIGTNNTEAIRINASQYATFKDGLSIQSDSDNRFLVRSNDYTISRIISRGLTGTNLDMGLFSLMSSDGTNNNIEKVRIDSAGGSWFNGGSVSFGGDIDAGAAGKLAFLGSSGNPSLLIKNNTATSNAAGTATLKFNQALTQAGGKIVSGRDSNYADGASRDSNLKFYTSTNATDTLVLTLDSDNAATFAGKVSVGGGDISTAQMALKGQQSLLSFVRGTSGDTEFFVSSDSARLYFSHTDTQSGNLILTLYDDKNAVFSGDVEIHNKGNDTTGKLTIAGNNNTGTPGAKTSGTIEHRGEHLKTVITHLSLIHI